MLSSQVEWVCTCSGIYSSPQMLTCEKMFEYPEAKAVIGCQTPNTGQQVPLQWTNLTETPISLLSMIFPKKIETSPVHLCGLQSHGHDGWTIPRQKTSAVLEETGIYTPKNLQTKPLPDMVSPGIWQETNLLVCVSFLYLCGQILPVSPLKILFHLLFSKLGSDSSIFLNGISVELYVGSEGW